MAEGTPCPTDVQLLALIEATLPDERQTFLADHLETCDACRQRLDSLAGQSQVIPPEITPLGDSPPHSDALAAVMHRLKSDTADPEETIVEERADASSLEFLRPSANPRHLGRLGKYEILELIGRGGMGTVFKARDAKLERLVAVKVLNPDLAASGAARLRFMREARAAAAIIHDHVVTIHAVDDTGAVPFLVMEYVSGVSLEDRIQRTGHLQIEEVLRIGMQIGSGLSAAHVQGIVHRDIKPSNILLENGVERVKITDFGLARVMNEAQATRSDAVLGTPQYMSPEQARGEPVDHRSDLFSLGCVLYAMCVGRSPFRAETPIGAIHRVCESTPRPIREVNPDIPEWFVAMVDRLLEKKREDRFQTADEVVDLFAQYLAQIQHPSQVVPRLRQPLSQRQVRKRRRFCGLCIGAVLLMLIGWIGWWGTQNSQNSSVLVAPRTEQSLPPGDLPPWDLSPGSPPPAVVPFDTFKAKEYQVAWAQYLGVPVEFENSIGMKFVLIPPGEFDMGSTEEDVAMLLEEAKAMNLNTWYIERIPAEAPQHRVRIQKAFYLGMYEVTQAEYERVMGTNPSAFCRSGERSELVSGQDTSRFPVERLSWEEAVEFCRKLSAIPAEQSLGRVYRLPREAEWEYACRAGTTTRWYGTDHEPALQQQAWYRINSGSTSSLRTHPVGQKMPNAWGLYDMHGNVWEKCQDWWSADYYAASPGVDPTGAPEGTNRVVRGGSFGSPYALCFRASYRGSNDPGDPKNNEGFRIAMTLPAASKPQPLPPWDLPPDSPSPAVAPFDATQAKQHQEAWAQHLGVPVEFENSIGMRLVLIPPGEFDMGSTEGEVANLLEKARATNQPSWLIDRLPDEAPKHRVRITRAFWLGRYEVTRGQFRRFVEDRGYQTEAERDRKVGAGWADGEWNQELGGDEADNHPVVNVNWNDAAAFCQWLSETEGLKYRLPTEAEWEYACRAGTTTRYSFGYDADQLGEYVWHSGNSGGRVHPVGQKLPNAWGLYDMYGNVWELCQDWRDSDYYSKSPVDDPPGPATGSYRVNRGGGFYMSAGYCRSAFRSGRQPSNQTLDCGFRLARSIVE